MGVVRIIAESNRFRKDRFSLRMVASVVQGCRLGPQGSRGKPLALRSLRYRIQLFVDALPAPRDRFPKALHAIREVRPFAFTWKIGFFSLRAIRNSVLTPGAL